MEEVIKLDKIIMNGMKFFAYHGVLPQERETGQNFIIDIELKLDLKKAGEGDKLQDTVDYSEVYALVQTITKSNKFLLIETLAEEISREILSRYVKVNEIIVCIKKPEAPIEGEFNWMGIEIRRSRNVS